MPHVKDMTGRRFGKWTVIRMADKGGYCLHATWWCRCVCGNEAEVRGDMLRKGKSTQCRSCANRTPGARPPKDVRLAPREGVVVERREYSEDLSDCGLDLPKGDRDEW